MNREPDEWQATRRSLLTRLRDAGDQTGWRQFFDTYWKLLCRVALKSGLTEAEAQDAVQETVIAVAKYMPEFRYQPARCSFKGWLLLLTRQRIAHQFRKRARTGRTEDTLEACPETAGSSGGPCDQIPDPAGSRLDALWDEEWEQHIISVALEEVKSRVSDRQFQIFDLYVRQSWPVEQVVRTLRVSAAQIYLARHRVGRVFKRALANARRAELHENA